MKTALDLVAAAKAGIHEVNVAQAQDAVQQADLPIDVREADEYAQGHLPGAVHMSRGMLEFKLTGNPAYQPRDLRVVLYCKTSGRAALSAQSLQAMGYLNVQSIAGGYDAWVAADLPVAKPQAPSFG